MNKEELNACLKSFYTSARKQHGQFYKSSSLKAIRAAIERYLRMPPHSKRFSIVADPAFTEANKILDAFVKDLRKSGKISGIVHKKAISKQQVEKLFQSGELGPADTKDPAQLQRTAWFYLGIYFGRRGRENQRDMNLLCLPSEPLHKEKSILSSTESFQARCQRGKTIKVAFPMPKMSRTRQYLLCQNLPNAR